MKILVSAIIPVYNSEKFLGECIESLRNQTLKEIEMIFINDGSTDNSLEILKKYEKIDSRIKVIDQKNGGPSTARNRGIEIAKGEYLSFIDSDDWVKSNMYEKMYNESLNSSIDIIVSDMINYKSQINQYYSKELELEKGVYNYEDIQKKVMPKFFKDNSFNSMANKLFKNSIVKESNLRLDEYIYYAEDWKFNVEFFKYAKSLAYINEAFYFYRRGYDSSSSIYKDNTFEQNGVNLYKHRKEYSIYFGIDKYSGSYDFFQTTYHCLIREVYRNDINLQSKLENIKNIINNKYLIEAISILNRNELNIKQTLIYILIKYKLTFMIYIYLFSKTKLATVNCTINSLRR